MVRPLFDEAEDIPGSGEGDIRGSGEGSPLVMPAQVYHVSHMQLCS